MQIVKHNAACKISRAAGILLLLSLLVPVLNWGLVLSDFISPGIETSLTILDDELLFRLVIIYDSIAILFPCYAGILSIKLLGSVPVSLFQILLGLWLLFKGIKARQYHKK